MKLLDKYNNIIFYVFVLILFILNCVLINQSVWIDEIFTINAVNANFSDMINILINDVHPPLYYLILKFFCMFTNANATFFKLLSIIPTFITIIVVRVFLKRNTNFSGPYNINSFLFALVTGLSSTFIHYNLEIRMYSFALLFVTCSGLLAYSVYMNPKSLTKWSFFILFSLLSAYTHYFALIAEVFIYGYLFVFLLLKNRSYWKNCLFASIITILLYIPWLLIFMKQFSLVKQDYWITFSASNIWNWVKFGFLDLNNIIISIILAFIVFCLIKLIFKKLEIEQVKEISLGLIFCSIPLLIIILAIVITILIRPLFVERYIIPVLGLFWLGIFILINSFKYKRILYTLVAIIFIYKFTFSYINTFKMECYSPTFNTVQEIINFSDNDDIFVSNMYEFTYFISKYYFPNNVTITLKMYIDNPDIYIDSDKKIFYFDNSDLTVKTLNNMGINLKYLYDANIDNCHYFKVYEILR